MRRSPGICIGVIPTQMLAAGTFAAKVARLLRHLRDGPDDVGGAPCGDATDCDRPQEDEARGRDLHDDVLYCLDERGIIHECSFVVEVR